MPLLACLALCLALLATPAYGQGDPIMPLEQVQRGMICEGRSVFRGTQIETFQAEILDVIAPNAGAPAGILFRASGPALADTGLGFGFSGSPIYCPDSEGVSRVIGAVALSIEDYGNDTALATPIEDMLNLPITTPAGARPATDAERNAKPMGSPMMVAGVGNVVRNALIAAARRRGIPLLSSPATAAQVTTGTDLQPGSAVAAGLSSGSVGLNAIGTVTYRDGQRIWAFGHPFEGVGARSLLLQGAFVHTIVGNPNPPGFTGLGTYKLASAGDVAGVTDFDGNSAISGVLGAPPTTIPLDVVAEDGRGERLPTSHSLIADESPLGHPNGFPAPSLVTSIAISDQVLNALDSSAGASFGRLCTRIELAEREKAMRFCNRYVGSTDFPGGLEIAMSSDASAAVALVEQYDREQLHVEKIRATLDVAEGLRFAVLRGASGPKRVSPGQRIRLTIRVQKPRQPVEKISFSMKIPGSVKPGNRTLRLTGSSSDPDEASLEAIFFGGLSPEEGGSTDGSSQPSTIAKLAEAVGDIHRYDGIRGTFRKPAGEGEGDENASLDELLGLFDPAAAGRQLYRDDELRIGGTAKVKFRVVAPRTSMSAP